METSILNSVKKVLGLDESYTAFDEDILLYTNSALSTLTQLGVGPAEGFMIEDASAIWDTFLGGDPRYNSVKNFVRLSVKLNFDPPPTSFAIAMMEKQLKEMEWRISVEREGRDWTEPVTSPSYPQVIDGGSP